MLVCIVASTAVYMAADSRQSPSGADNVQKVFLVGKTAILGHGGIGVIPFNGPSGGAWDAAREAERVANRTPVEAPKDQFRFIGRELLRSLNQGLLQRSEEIRGSDPHLVVMFIARDLEGHAFFFRQEFKVVGTVLPDGTWRYHGDAAPIQVVVDGKSGATGTWWDVPPEYQVGLRRLEGLTHAAISAFIKDVSQQSESCRRQIGGQVRLAVVDGAGARWMPQ
jgi:hypothetical protein